MSAKNDKFSITGPKSTIRGGSNKYFRLFVPLGLIISSSTIFSAFGQSSILSYQGRLSAGGTPANGSYDLAFSLWSSLSGGAQIGGTLTNANTFVSNGLFTVTLDF